jgi:hypothetical protein
VGIVTPDAFITDQRAKVVRELPWPIPALVIVETTDDDAFLEALRAYMRAGRRVALAARREAA